MSFSEVSSESWLGRLGKSLIGILVGGVAVVGSVCLLFWNEGRAVQTAKSLDEGAGAVVSVAADKVDAGNESKLVHISGEATTEDVLHDKEFKIEQTAIHLARHVEMYQWEEDTKKEKRKKLGGGTETVTTYHYTETWADDVIDSKQFNKKYGADYQNPDTMPVQSQTLSANTVTVGAYKLSDSLRDDIDNSSSISVSSENIPEEFADQMQPQGTDTLYLGADPSVAQIGDCRITFSVTLPGEVSVIAQQTGDTFQPYQTQAGDALSMLRKGRVSADQMFEMAQADNAQLTWILRGVGAIIMFVGLMMITKPISVLADVIPFLGDLLETGLALVSGLLTIAGACVVIGVAWVFYRPLIGVPLLAIALGAIVMIFMKRPKRRAALEVD